MHLRVKGVVTVKFWQQFVAKRSIVSIVVMHETQLTSDFYETEYKCAKYGLRIAITVAKRQYREKLDSFYSTADAGWIWQGLQHIVDFTTITSTISSSDSLPDDLNTFFRIVE